jgi:hypothetical protein
MISSLRGVNQCPHGTIFSRVSKDKLSFMVQTVIGIFNESSNAECAVHELMDNSFDREHIDISLPPDPAETRGDGTDENGVL